MSLKAQLLECAACHLTWQVRSQVLTLHQIHFTHSPEKAQKAICTDSSDKEHQL